MRAEVRASKKPSPTVDGRNHLVKLQMESTESDHDPFILAAIYRAIFLNQDPELLEAIKAGARKCQEDHEKANPKPIRKKKGDEQGEEAK